MDLLPPVYLGVSNSPIYLAIKVKLTVRRACLDTNGKALVCSWLWSDALSGMNPTRPETGRVMLLCLDIDGFGSLWIALEPLSIFFSLHLEPGKT
jgi:hypothetical protein